MVSLRETFISSIDQYPQNQKETIISVLNYIEHHASSDNNKINTTSFEHSLAVAQSLSNREFDFVMVSATLLHHITLDESMGYDNIQKLFGTEISSLVKGIKKISSVPIINKSLFFGNEDFCFDRIDNYRKLLLSLSSDMRVMIIKLFDRLHNMQTIEQISQAKQKYYALESVLIYAQIAERIGLSELKSKIEDLAFPYAYPEEYNKFIKYFKNNLIINDNFIDQKTAEIKNFLSQKNMAYVKIQGRIKHLYSIYSKLKTEKETSKINFYDLYGIRIIVPTVENCYQVLGLIHEIYKPMPGRIIDMIASPKGNGYQSLHTTIQNSPNDIFEVQIRTPEMHRHAEFGAAAHWHYKTSDNRLAISKSQKEWLLELQNACKLNSNRDFLDYIKSDLFVTRIFIFSPAGDIFSMPKGSSVLDFAYRVHTRIGDQCSGAKINGILSSIDTVLNNGDSVEIVTSKRTRPNINWLRLCKTSYAKQKIKQFLKKIDYDKLVSLGRDSFNNIKKEFNLPDVSEITASHLLSQSRLPYKSFNDLLIALYNHSVSKHTLIKTIYPKYKFQISKKEPVSTARDLQNNQFMGLKSQIAKCCNPNHSSKIIGYIGKDHIIKIHKINCKFVKKTDPKRQIFIDPFDS